MGKDFEVQDENLYLKPCPDGGKICYDKKDAQQKRNWVERRGRGKDMRIYQCPSCGYWHLTKETRKKFNKVIKAS